MYFHQYTPLAHILKGAIQALITRYLINLPSTVQGYFRPT